MQLLIDTSTDSAAEMLAVARMLTESAAAATAPSNDKAPEPDEVLKVTEPQNGDIDTVAAAHGLQRLPASAPASVPLPPPAPNAIAESGRETDSAGVVWCAALHTSTRSKTIDGKWKPRKPRDGSIPLPPPPVVPAATSPPVPLPPPPVSPPVNNEDDAAIEPDEAGGAEVVPTGPVAGLTFAEFLPRLTAGMNDGSISQARIAEVQAELGLTSLFQLGAAEADKLPRAIAAFGITP